MGDLRLGTVRPDSMYVGEQTVAKIYYGVEEVWAGVFQPPDIPGLELWLDATDSDTIHEDTVPGRLSGWDDKSGNLRHVTQPNPSDEPTTGVSDINGTNAIGFSGTQSIWRDLTADPVCLTGQTIFTAWVRIGAAAQYECHPVQIADSANGRPGTRWITSWFLSNQSTGGWTDLRNAPFTSPQVIVDVIDRDSGGVGTHQMTEWLNGGTPDVSQSKTAGYFTSGQLCGIGRREGANSVRANGHLGEVLVYDGALSVADMNLVGEYLAAKRGLTWTPIP